ncbi:MAG: trypsin-like peptidase domain-containing protein, partial [Pyrinomonadaceae bacterium]
MDGKKFAIGNAQVGLVSRGAALGLLLLLMGACGRNDYPAFRLASTSEPATNNPPLNSPAGATGVVPGISYADVVNRVSPAVITIRSQLRVRAPEQYPFMDDPWFREFFGQRGVPQPPPERRRSGLGSGVIVTADGYILTNHHVIDGAEQIKVDLNDNRTLDARVVGNDPPSDLALLKVEASNLPRLPLGNSDNVRVG